VAQNDKLRVMLVDDSTETREYLQQLLQFEAHIELVGMASNGQQAVEVAREAKPDLILMDINMPVMDGISAAEIISKEMPSVRIVMMSVQSEMAYLRRAMQAGAREYLIKPFTHDELMNILGEVSSLAPPPVDVGAAATPGMAAVPAQPAQVATLITIFSPRGGAGCSTVALNLAIALQGQRKANVLLIDGNLRFGALDAMLNLQVTRSIADLPPSLADNDPEVVHTATLPHTSGIRLLAAPPRPEMADLVSLQHLRQVLALARRRYDYIVADLGSRLDDGALHFMDVAERIVVLLTPDIPAIKNARLFLEVALSLEYDLNNILFVLNRANPRGGITAEAVERHLKHPISVNIPDNPRLVQNAINRGVPLILYEREQDKTMPLTQQLLALAELMPQPGEVKEKAIEEVQERPASEKAPAAAAARSPRPKKKGFLGRLFRRDG
jgi:pilus assembly protein CpaE